MVAGRGFAIPRRRIFVIAYIEIRNEANNPLLLLDLDLLGGHIFTGGDDGNGRLVSQEHEVNLVENVELPGRKWDC